MLTLILAAALVDVHLSWTSAAQSHPHATIHAHRVDANVADADFDASPIALAAGQWFVSAIAPGYWCEPRLITVSDQPADVALELEPATRLRARVKLPRDARANEMTIHLQTADRNIRSRSVVCPITDGRADCDVPAGEQDLAFRIAGYATLFRWNEPLPQPRIDLGILTFKRGSTFSGRVEMPAAKDAKVDVVLTPFNNAQENEVQIGRKNGARLTVQPNARGFFAFNVAPGRYLVHAASCDLMSDEVEVNVIDGRESVLRDTLRLAPLSKLTVNVHPALDPWNKHWKVTIRRSNGGERTEIASSEGRVEFASLSPGAYNVAVHRSEQDGWYSTMIDVDGDKTIDAAIETMRVRGSVTLGDQPLAARVTFIGERGVRLPVWSKADGSFVTLLPKVNDDKPWRVEIESEAAHVARTLDNVTLSDADQPEAFVDLHLPVSAIAGVIVDRNGARTGDALIDIITPDQRLRQIESADGAFQLTGLASGRYKISAMTHQASTESAVEVELTDDTTKNVTLIVDSIRHFRGVVRSSFGSVITGGVFVTPAGLVPSFMTLLPLTPEGRFDVPLPPHTDEVVVIASAPGFSSRMMRTPVPLDGEAEIAVDQQGGTLIIESSEEPVHVFLTHNGATLPLSMVDYLAGGHRLTPHTIEFSQIEPGTYSICASADRCDSGTLARGGRLVLTPPAERESKEASLSLQ